MRKLFSISTLIFIFILQVNDILGQELLRPLPYNPTLNQQNVIEKGSFQKADNSCEVLLPKISLEVVANPDCVQNNGSIILTVEQGEPDSISVTGSEQVVAINGLLSELEPIGNNQYQLNNLFAGAYFITVTDEFGRTAKENVALHNVGANSIDEQEFSFTKEFCSTKATISVNKESTGANIELTSVFRTDGSLGTRLVGLAATKDLEVGTYYVEQSKAIGIDSLCYSYYIFDIESEPYLTVEEPFVEDFSTSLYQPDPNTWEDQHAYVNRNYGYDPPSFGVVTLDGLNDQGDPHIPANGLADGPADTLTSQAFCLADAIAGNLPQTDTLYFNFFYQPQGYGDFPNGEDGLILEFLAPEEIDTSFVDSTQIDIVQLDYLDEAQNDTIQIDIIHDNIIPFDNINFIVFTENEDTIYVDTLSNVVTVIDTFYKQIDTIYTDTIWQKVWETVGNNSSAWVENPDGTFSFTLPFEEVEIENPTENLFYNGFQFRFRNVATASGNNDHWNLDYIRLGVQSLFGEIDDITIVNPLPSLLQSYQAMPWTHFQENMQSPDFNSSTLNTDQSLAFRNLSIEDRGFTGTYTITNICTDEIIYNSIGPGNKNIAAESLEDRAYNLNQTPDNEEIPFAIDLLEKEQDVEQVTLESSITISNAGDNVTSNNIIKRKHYFSDYYAYDDGTAEKAYGLFGFESQLAYQFDITVPEGGTQLTAIDISFIQMNNDVSSNQFSLVVWSDIEAFTNNSTELTTNKATDSPTYFDGRDVFARYYLEEAVSLDQDATIYIGIRQEGAEELNIGFDSNTNALDNIFYNTSGTWLKSSLSQPGALMMHPVFDTAEPPVSVEDITDTSDFLTVFPNPANNQLHVQVQNSKSATQLLQVHDFAGRLILEQNMNSTAILDISHLASGVYLLKVSDNQRNELGIRKFVKN